MECKVCGANSGKYPLCRSCNSKKEKGEIIKCINCGSWHLANSVCCCPKELSSNEDFLYEAKKTLIIKSEQGFFEVIKASLPENYYVFPQINLATIIKKTDDSRYHNELFRNVDFLITDNNYKPLIVVEINDPSHLRSDRRERDEKVQKICEEAGISLIKFWTDFGINPDYIKNKINETLNSPPKRVHHFNQTETHNIETPTATPVYENTPVINYSPQQQANPKKKKGCYVATCVYGNYDCPQVWTLRRYRDDILMKNIGGRMFINLYYAISPTLVKLLGNTKSFKSFCKKILDYIVNDLQSKGFENTPYID